MSTLAGILLSPQALQQLRFCRAGAGTNTSKRGLATFSPATCHTKKLHPNVHSLRACSPFLQPRGLIFIPIPPEHSWLHERSYQAHIVAITSVCQAWRRTALLTLYFGAGRISTPRTSSSHLRGSTGGWNALERYRRRCMSIHGVAWTRRRTVGVPHGSRRRHVVLSKSQSLGRRILAGLQACESGPFPLL